MKVRDIMSSKVQDVTPATPLVEIAKIMQKEDVGSVPVCEQDKILGMVTDRDIVLRVVAAGKNPTSVKAQDVMSTNIITIRPDEDIHKASEVMAKNQIRRLPVVDQDKLVGILAIGDMAVEQIHVNEAGEALSDISQGIHH